MFFLPATDRLFRSRLRAQPSLSVVQKATKAFRKLDFSHTLPELRYFLGAGNVYGRFMKEFSKIAQPLTDITRKNVSPSFTSPETSVLQTCDIPKQRLASLPVLAVPKLGRPYTLACDACACQLGCALLQKQLDETLRLVGYCFCSLNDTKGTYHVTEWEDYTAVWATTFLRPSRERTRFTVRTDRDALRWLIDLTEL